MKIIRISAMWCPACIIMSKYWNRIEEKYKNFKFVTYDIDMDEEVKNYNVGNTLPVIIMIKENKEVKRLIGEKTEKEVEEFIEG